MSPSTPLGSVNSGPVVIAESSIRALNSIRHEWLLENMFGSAVLSAGVDQALVPLWNTTPRSPFLHVHQDVPDVVLPPRLVHVQGTDRLSIKLALHLSSRLLIIEGKALLEKVKLSFIKSMGVIPLLVQAYQEGRIKAVKPLLIALERKGHEMPPEPQMQALLAALDDLG